MILNYLVSIITSLLCTLPTYFVNLILIIGITYYVNKLDFLMSILTFIFQMGRWWMLQRRRHVNVWSVPIQKTKKKTTRREKKTGITPKPMHNRQNTVKHTNKNQGTQIQTEYFSIIT